MTSWWWRLSQHTNRINTLSSELLSSTAATDVMCKKRTAGAEMWVWFSFNADCCRAYLLPHLIFSWQEQPKNPFSLLLPANICSAVVMFCRRLFGVWCNTRQYSCSIESSKDWARFAPIKLKRAGGRPQMECQRSVMNPSTLWCGWRLPFSWVCHRNCGSSKKKRMASESEDSAIIHTQTAFHTTCKSSVFSTFLSRHRNWTLAKLLLLCRWKMLA